MSTETAAPAWHPAPTPRPDQGLTGVFVGIFADIENLTDLDERDLERILHEVAQYGPVVIRRAYGCWSSQHLTKFQRPLTRLGFEMIHAWHPVAGKDSADILMVVDVMYAAMKVPGLRTIVLVTSDSDFSPLFRRLREMGLNVIGVGRPSPLSQMVQQTCTRFVYLGKPEQGVSASRREDAVEAAIHILRQHGGTFDLAGLKSQLLLMDPSFDERNLGYVDFRTFVRSIPEVRVLESGGVWLATLSDLAEPGADTGIVEPGQSPYYRAQPTPAVYQGLLRKKGWRTARPDAVEAVLQLLPSLESATASELRNRLVEELSETFSGTDVRKAWTVVFRSFLLDRVDGVPDEGPSTYRWTPGLEKEAAIDAIDVALFRNLKNALSEYQVEWAPEAVRELVYGPNEPERIERLWEQAGAAPTRE